VEIRRTTLLEDFMIKHARSVKSIPKWMDVVEAAQWASFDDVKKDFNTADQFDDLIVFDVGGNNFRIVVIAYFNNGVILIKEVMTHAEYDKWNKRRSKKRKC